MLPAVINNCAQSQSHNPGDLQWAGSLWFPISAFVSSQSILSLQPNKGCDGCSYLSMTQKWFNAVDHSIHINLWFEKVGPKFMSG